jgi:hypothetical protein
MKGYYLSLFVTVLLLSGCAGQKQPEPETAMFRDFSLASVVERMNVPELKPVSGGKGSSEDTGEKTRRRRDFHLTFQIEEREGTKFNGDSFIFQLKDEIEKVIQDSGVRLNSGGLIGDSLHFDYSKEGHEGWLEIVGTRVEGDRFKLWAMLREVAEREKK